MADPFTTEGSLITDLHWFAQHNGARQWLVWTTDGEALRAFNGSKPAGVAGLQNPWDDIVDAEQRVYDGSTRSRLAIKGPWQGQTAQTWGGRLYMVNGFNEAIVFDGDKVERAGFATRPQPVSVQPIDRDFNTTTIDVGVGSTFKTSGYRYIVTFLNERGQESEPSAPSEMVILNVPLAGIGAEPDNTGKSFVQMQIPQGPEECVARRIYRTADLLDSQGNAISLGAAEIYYAHSEIQDNAVVLIEDGLPDSNLGLVVDTLNYGPFPPGTKYLAVFKNTMFASGSSPNEVYHSRPLFPEVFPPTNVLTVGDDDMSQITGMYPTKNALVVFKGRGIYLIKGDPTSGFSTQTLTRDTGCMAPRSLAELPGLGLVFLSSNSVQVLRGTIEDTGTASVATDISAPIQDYIDRINKSAMIGVRSAVYHRDKEYWLAVPTTGLSDNNLVLVYHYAIGEWSIRENFPIACMVESRDHRGYLFFGSYDDDHLGLHVYSRGWPGKDGPAIEPLWESIHHDFGSVYSTVQPLSVVAYSVALSDNPLSLDFRINRSITDVREDPISRPQQDPGDALAVYGTAEWGEALWGFFRPTAIRYDVSTRDKDRTREFQVSFSAERKIQIVGYDIEVQVGEQRAITPMNTIFDPGRRG
jgi:hypothetical protein